MFSGLEAETLLMSVGIGESSAVLLCSLPDKLPPTWSGACGGQLKYSGTFPDSKGLPQTLYEGAYGIAAGEWLGNTPRLFFYCL